MTPRQQKPIARPAFTLVELLVVMSIIAILSSLVAGVTTIAGESGRQRKTEQLVTRLHTLLMEQYDGFRDRRVDLRTDRSPAELLEDAGYNMAAVSALPANQQRVAARLVGAREQLKMEMPDRWSDFLLFDIAMDGSGTPTLPTPADYGAPAFLSDVPTLAQFYRSQYEQLSGVTAETLLANQGAECLYLTVIFATGDGEARSLFKESDIADTDGDGALEFVDGWGNPIQFLRWAPGFESDLQLSQTQLEQLRSTVDDDAVRTAVAADPDPLDLFRVDQPLNDASVFNSAADTGELRGYRLVPLIYSAGSDEEVGTRADSGFVNAQSDPYVFDTDDDNPAANKLGEPLNDTQTDNVTNHLILAK